MESQGFSSSFWYTVIAVDTRPKTSIPFGIRFTADSDFITTKNTSASRTAKTGTRVIDGRSQSDEEAM